MIERAEAQKGIRIQNAAARMYDAIYDANNNGMTTVKVLQNTISLDHNAVTEVVDELRKKGYQVQWTVVAGSAPEIKVEWP